LTGATISDLKSVSTAGLGLTPGALSNEQLQANDGVKTCLAAAQEGLAWVQNWLNRVRAQLPDEPETSLTCFDPWQTNQRGERLTSELMIMIHIAVDSYAGGASNRDIEGWLAMILQDSPIIGLATFDDDAANAHKAHICDSLSIRQAVSSLCEYALATTKNKSDWEANTSLLRHWKKMVVESERDAARSATQKAAWAKPTTGSDGTGSGGGEGNEVSGSGTQR
jgi:hypothetical protein